MTFLTATIQCPEGLSCVPKSLCSTSSIPGIQERVSNVRTKFKYSQVIIFYFSAQARAFQDLPQTECPSQMECVKDQFCDKSGSISPVRVQLTKQEKTKRGELIVRRLDVNMEFIFFCFSPVLMLQPAYLKSAVKSKTASRKLNNY